MPTIDINLDDTPDEMPKVSVGEHIFDVKDVRQDQTAAGDDRITVELEVNNPSDPDHGKRTWDQFVLKFMPARVKFKQFCKAAGLEATGTGVDSTDLIGCTVKGVVKTRMYKDKDTDEQVETTNVAKYLVPVAA